MSGVLLDTNAILWLGLDPRYQTHVLQDWLSGEDVFLSEASALEMAIKVNIGKLILPPPFALDFTSAFRQMADRLAAVILPVGLEQADRLARLPLHHRDPFDRMLIVQALQKNLAVLTADRQFQLYEGLEVIEIRPA